MDEPILEENSSGSRRKLKKKQGRDSFHPETFTASVSDGIQDEAVTSSGVQLGLEKSERKRKSRKDKKSTAADEEDQDDAQFASQLIDAALPAGMLIEPIEGDEPVKKKRKERTRVVQEEEVREELMAAVENDQVEPVKKKKKKRTEAVDADAAILENTLEDAEGEMMVEHQEETSSRKKSKSVLAPLSSEISKTEILEESSASCKGILKKKSDGSSEATTVNGVKVVKKSHPPSTALATKPTGNSYVDPAIKYLRMWKSARLSWTFQKVRQVWLLRNWRDRLKMSDEDFVIFLSYIVDLKGLSRTKTSDEAKSVRDEYESSETYGADDELKQKLYDRAGKIVEVLLPI